MKIKPTSDAFINTVLVTILLLLLAIIGMAIINS